MLLTESIFIAGRTGLKQLCLPGTLSGHKVCAILPFLVSAYWRAENPAKKVSGSRVVKTGWIRKRHARVTLGHICSINRVDKCFWPSGCRIWISRLETGFTAFRGTLGWPLSPSARGSTFGGAMFRPRGNLDALRVDTGNREEHCWGTPWL